MSDLESVITGTSPWCIHVSDVLEGLRLLPDECVHCVVTSPPYFQLRDYQMDGQIGLEPTPGEFVTKMAEVFREVRRVLRGDGTCWLNIGDSYSTGGNGGGSFMDERGAAAWKARKAKKGWKSAPPGLKHKDLVGIPWLLAFALRDDGWYLRSEIIWHKRAPMPESVNDRPTKAHEQVFLLTKSSRYFYDQVSSAEKATGGSPGNKTHKGSTAYKAGSPEHRTKAGLCNVSAVETRNMRTVWSLSPESFRGAHFATMPTELARRCIVAGTSEHGCCAQCGAPWSRIVEKSREATRPGTDTKVMTKAETMNVDSLGWPNATAVGNRDPQRHITKTVTTGWKIACECGNNETLPCLVLDPFAGAGTTLLVARRLGCRAIGFELNPQYAAMARERIEEDAPLFN